MTLRDNNYAPLPEFDDRQNLAELLPLDTPISLFIDPSSLCNFHCKFCPTGDPQLIKASGRTQQYLPIELYKKILGDIAEFPRKIKVLRLYKDGEPMLHKQFVELVQLARDSGRFERIETTTNGSRLSPETNARLIDAGIDRIVISIEGVTDETYRSFAGTATEFQSIVKNVADLYRRRNSCLIHVKTVKENLKEGEEKVFLDTFSAISDRIFIEHTVPSWPVFEISYVPVAEFLRRGAYGQAVAEKKVCAYPFYSMAINSDGTVSPCCVDWDRALVLGDLNQESLADIWQGKTLRDFRCLHLEGHRKEHPICGKCGQISHCSVDDIDANAKRLLKVY